MIENEDNMENGHLIQAVATYTGAIEKRLKELEARVAELEKKLNAAQAAEVVQQDLIDELEQRIAELEARPMADIPEEEVSLTTEEGQTKTESAPQEAATGSTYTEEAMPQEAEDESVTATETESPVEAWSADKIIDQPTAEPEPTIVEPEPTAEPTIAPNETATTEPKEVAKESVAPAPATEKATDKPSEAPKATAYGTPVSDLAKAISIGDRFLFQRELFAKNAELMQRTIADLNGLNTFGEAMEYLRQHFDWDKELQSYELFMTALHRRFGE